MANTAWAFATLGQWDQKLFAALARAAQLRMSEFNAQTLAIMAWALAKLGQSDHKMFAALARAAQLRMREFNV